MSKIALAVSLIAVAAYGGAAQDVAADAGRIAMAAKRLSTMAEISPNIEVDASAFFKEAKSPETIQPYISNPNWQGVTIVALRHYLAGNRQGGFPVPEGMDFADAVKAYQEWMEARGVPPDKLRIVGADLSGTAAALRKLSEREGVMVEVRSSGFYGSAPAFTAPPPAEAEAEGGGGCEAEACASPFDRPIKQ